MSDPRAWIVVGLAFGDEGKGTTTDWIVRATGARVVVRFNGGPQAGHNVIAPDGRWHCFAQFGAGTFVPGTRTVLGRPMLVELENLVAEATVLAGKGVDDAPARTSVDPACPVITPMHKMVGQLREVASGAERRGSCGMGVGEAARDASRGAGVRAGEVRDEAATRATLENILHEKLGEADALVRSCPAPEARQLHEYFVRRCQPRRLARRWAEIIDSSGVRVQTTGDALCALPAGGGVVLEGAQGALLDRVGGFAPYVTQSDTTAQGAQALLGEAGLHRLATKVGVLRSYGHRHGPGPFVTEDKRLARRYADPFNVENRWQGPMRLGHLDLVALRYGLALHGGVDWLALTGLDRLSGLRTLRVCTEYEVDGPLSEAHLRLTVSRARDRRARVSAILPPTPGAAESTALATLLRRCRPSRWVELAGWDTRLDGIRAIDELPRAARVFLEWLSSCQGLGVPVGLVSVGPDARGKIPVGDVVRL